MKLKKSPFLHIVPVDAGNFALYHNLSLETVFLDQDFVREHLENTVLETSPENEAILLQLRDLGFLVEENSDGQQLLREYQDGLDEPAINILYLLLTDSCNIRCRYCYFLAPMPDDYRPTFMSEGVAIRSLDLFARCVQRSISKGHHDQHIVLYGGEPTLNKATLMTALRHIDELKGQNLLPTKIGITLNTNGLLLDDEILEQCKKTNVTVAISIDGPREIHDKMRVFASGNGTFDRVIAGYKKAQETGVKVGVCVTIDHHNLYQMKEIVTWLSDELKAKGLGFNILIDNSCGKPTDRDGTYAEVVAEQLIESFKLSREIGLYEDRIMRRVKNFLDKTPVMSDCGACGLQLVISPDGQIGVCQAFCGERKFFVSEPFETFDPEKHEYWKRWRRRSPLSNEVCHECIALGNCGGGCPYNAYRASGSIEAIDERFCAHAKATTLFLLGDLWKKQAQEM